mmetsp:Transcript_37539/g.97089  ORF Transcript_37539/g.97089 Transcript_37539/m.97089 type:complete len:150 (-) Transcript_37539:236-685(-)
MSASAPVVVEAQTAPFVVEAAPIGTYATPVYSAAPVTYVQMPMASSVSAPMGGSAAVPQMMYAAPAAPAVFNIPPELFAKLASGGSMTPEEVAALTGAPAPAAEPAPVAFAPSPITSASAPVSSVKSAVASGKKSKKMKVSKKKAKGCC